MIRFVFQKDHILEDLLKCILEEKQDQIQIITETYETNTHNILHLGIFNSYFSLSKNGNS